MNPLEAAKLIVMITQLVPAQRFDDEAPEAWAFALDDVAYSDARLALREVVRAHAFVNPCAILEAAREIRAARLATVPINPADVDELVCAGDPVCMRHELRYLRDAARDGRLDADGYRAYIAAGIPVSPEGRSLAIEAGERR